MILPCRVGTRGLYIEAPVLMLSAEGLKLFIWFESRYIL